MNRELPVWRSLMYVPVNVDKYVDKAHTRGADVIQLDVEDSVPPAEKDKARTLVEAAAKRVRRGGPTSGRRGGGSGARGFDGRS